MEDPCSETEDDPDSSASSQAAMDPVTASLGPIGPLRRQLHSLTTPPGVSENEIPSSLKKELVGLCTDLKYVSEAEDPSLTAKCWMKQVRELLYDANDFFDKEKHSSAGKDALDEFKILEARAEHARERRERYGIAPPSNNPTILLPEARAEHASDRRERYGIDRAEHASERPKRYGIDLSFWDHSVFLRYAEAGRVKLFHYLKEILLFFRNLITSFVFWVLPRLRPVHTDIIDHELANLLGGKTTIAKRFYHKLGWQFICRAFVRVSPKPPDGEEQRKVVSIVGPEGVGKTTIAKRFYHKLGWQFNCRAFVRVSPKPDMRRLLASIFIQIQRKQPTGSWDTELLIEEIAKHLRNKRYFIIIDDLWTTPVWDIISRAFPDGDCHSRIITTTQIEDVALACCSYQSEYILKMNPLNDDQSRKLFFNRVLGSKGEDGCPKDFKEVSYGIIRKCGGLPLATIYIAGLLLRREMGQWENVERSLSSTFRTNGNPEGMEVVNLIYNDLPRYLKTCLLYLIMYPEDYTIGKNDLVKQWVAEGFIKAVKGEETEKTAEGYFDELVSRGIIQPVDTNYKSEVLSCAVHHLVLDLIRYKSMEENFITTVDNFESTPELPDKVRRLSVRFGGAKSANIPESIRMSQVRSLFFYGFFECVPSIVDYRLLQVLILDIWADQDKRFDLTRICELFRLRYLKIECNITVVLPDKVQGLQHLRTLQIDARLSAVPSDIGHLEKLLHLCLPSQANLPAGIGHMTSLRSLGYFNLSNNSRDNVLGLGKLINLWDLRLTCSTVESNTLVGNIKHLVSILGKLSKLKSLIVDASASSSSISWDGLNSVSPAPTLLERLELPQICIFPSLPRWFGELRRLCILKIAVSELSREDIDIIKGLDALTALSLYVWITPTGGIVFGKEGFRALRYFKFTCTTPCLTFEKDAMPNVQRLKLRFNANGLEQYDPVRAGFEHLLGLKEISAKIGSVGADEYDSIAALWMNVFSKIPSSPIFNMQSVDRIFNGDRKNSSARNEEKHRPTETVQDAGVEVRSNEQYFAGEGKQAEADSGTSVASGSSLEKQILGPRRSLVHGATTARERMDAALSAAQWMVGKALAPVTDGLLEAWGASKSLGPNVKALTTELLYVQATLEIASGKQLGGQAMEKLLQKLRDSAHDAEDLLDELDYFRIHDELHGTYASADEHAEGARQRAHDKSSSAPNANQADEEVRGHMHKLGNLLPCSSVPPVDADDDSVKSTLYGIYMHKASWRKHAEEIPKLGFNRVDVSERIKRIVEELQPVRTELTTILHSCSRNATPDTSQSRPITTGKSMEPKLYGRDHTVNNIIHDITKRKYCGKDLTVLPIVGPRGIGKTTLMQYIYENQEVQNHFQVKIWVRVSLSFNLNKILEEIKERIPRVKREKEGRPEEVIEQRLKSKRLLLVLDDIWECSNEDDWKRLLLPLKTSQEMGNMILVTTRFQAIAQMVKTTDRSIELEGLESKEFRELFFAFVFRDEQCRRDHSFLLKTGDKIMAKLKGSPLAAKTVGRLLRKNLNLGHWRRVLESKEWEAQTGSNEIMPALKLSYDYLPFHLQQCFSCSALFPEDYHFRSSELINLWIGLDILQPGARKQTHEDIGLSNLNELVTHGFFREEETNGHPSYVMHGLLHDLALNVASHECLSLHRSNVGSVQIQPCIRHLSIIIDDVGHDNAVSGENFKSELRKLKTKLKVEHLQTVMLFGGMDESFASILRDLFWEANALRVLHLHRVSDSVDSILYNFSTLVHLRYLCLGTKFESQMHLPHTIFRFYHLRILDLGCWYGSCDLPKDMSNLAKLCRFYTPSEELHSHIYNVGKLKLLEELKVFRVNKQSEGFEPKQLEHLTELRELGIYNLEKIHTKEEATEAKLIEKNYLQRLTLDWDIRRFEPKQLEHLTELRELGIYNLEKIHTKEEATEAKLIEKNYLQRLTLDWDIRRSNAEPNVETVVLESLQPHRYLQELCIRGYRGPSCPTWLGDEQSFCRLISLTLIDLESFEKWVPRAVHLFPLLQELIIKNCPKLLELPFSNHIVYPLKQDGKIDWFPKLQQLEIKKCPEFSSVIPISWTETLCSVKIEGVKLLRKFEYSKSSSDRVKLSIHGKHDLHSLDQVLVFNKETGLERLELEKCPPLELRHLLMLTSLKRLVVLSCDVLGGPLGGQGDVKWQLPVECLVVCDPTGRELTELLAHLPRLSSLTIKGGEKITQLVVGVDLQKKTSTISELEEDEVVAEAAAELTVEQEKEEDGMLLFPPNLSDSLRDLDIDECEELVLMAPAPTLLPDAHNEKIGGGWLQALRCLQRLKIHDCPKFLSAWSSSSPSCRLFPSSLQYLQLTDVKGMGTLEPLSNLTSLTQLDMRWCGWDLRCKGLLHLLTTGEHLSELKVYGSRRFFAGWDPRSEVLQVGGGGEQQLQLVSTLRVLRTFDATGLLAEPICSFLSSSLTKLSLHSITETRFSKEQEDALHLLASLQELKFKLCDNFTNLPAGLHKLTNLNKLKIRRCSAVRSLPKDGLPKSLQVLDVNNCGNKELTQQCRGLVGTIPNIILD